eukprot:scaffold256880_cov46-Prasinocladus_malaysianus.AAC.1
MPHLWNSAIIRLVTSAACSLLWYMSDGYPSSILTLNFIKASIDLSVMVFFRWSTVKLSLITASNGEGHVCSGDCVVMKSKK